MPAVRLWYTRGIWINSQDSSLVRDYVSEIMRSLRKEKIVP